MAETTAPEPNAANDTQTDDKCIGNRRVRTVILCALIFTFYIFAFGYLWYSKVSWKTFNDSLNTDQADGAIITWSLICSGLIISMIGCVTTVVLYFIPKCDKRLGRVGGVILIIGGALYILGWGFYIYWYKTELIDYTSLSDELKQDFDYLFLAWFGEALLPSGSCIILGLDVLFLLFDSEKWRLALNLGLLCGASILTGPAYVLVAADDDDSVMQTKEGVLQIGLGYFFIFLATALYLLLFFTSFCHNILDRFCVRLFMALLFFITGLICSIGYWIYAGDHGGGDGTSIVLGDDSIENKTIVYYVGYTIIILGLCAVWALDITWDDYKERQERR